MTARASTPEHVCSGCRSLVLRGEAADAPTCDDCGRVICDYCALGGLCAVCFNRHYSAPLEVGDDELSTLVVVDGVSVVGVRPDFWTQLDEGAADDFAA